jgi:ssDNA-binding Zn-finger/Zn-ribbon topoisomerase 1
MTTRKYHKKYGKTRKNKGGKAVSSSGAVKLKYKEKEVICDVCGSNHYTENTGSFGKSKLRSGVGQIFLGEAAEILDTTSVIIYTCNTCGLCKIIRNKDPLLITSQPV